ncbi:lamin Dm0 isoform X2 [Eurytemora carolleeae]|uniref:lamin Dm0 isoform X1 n=1 Tax=Eurytemora carolleeae TaxID=1294199 RepID=UPI000C75C70C|nr:lamin Dm0 isoform X1 [Eurytemora carolleeae]XP_023342854.1 lamin Dm0 isoform X2 [Eurytemora carolleeae]|eukprot:XP_023342853.1 lamin Dm0-like isoform X1 [Eurytemora affinis]
MYRSTSTSSGYSASGMMSPTVKDLEGMRSANLKELNSRLVSYVEKVRMLHQATDVLDSITKQSKGDGKSMQEVKVQYEAEISDWRAKYEELLSHINKAKIDASNLKQDNKQLTVSLGEKAASLRERDAAIASMEAEINELFSKLNMLQSEKGKFQEREQLISKDVERFRIEVESARKSLDKEKIRNGELEARLRAYEQEMTFKVQVIERELAEEKKRGRIDISSIDTKLKGEYEARLQAELKKLRRMYEEQTEKARNEYMTVHSKKLAEIQQVLNRERSENSSATIELKDVGAKIAEYKKIIGSLEKTKLELTQSAGELEQNLREQGAAFRAQMTAKDKEIYSLQEQLKVERVEYEALLKINNDLDLEIEIYRNIIDAELDRLQKMNESGSVSMMERLKGAAGNSSSDSDEEKSRYSSRSQDSVDGRKISRQMITSTTTRRTSKARF